MQTLLLKIFLCLFRFKVSQREAQLGYRDAGDLLDELLGLGRFLWAVEGRVNWQFTCGVHERVLLFESGRSACGRGVSRWTYLPSEILWSFCHHAHRVCGTPKSFHSCLSPIEIESFPSFWCLHEFGIRGHKWHLWTRLRSIHLRVISSVYLTINGFIDHVSFPEMIEFFHKPIPSIDLPPVSMLDLINLSDHPLLLELDLALIHTHMPLAQLLYPKLLPIRESLSLVNPHLLLKVRACRGKLPGVAIFKQNRHRFFLYVLVLNIHWVLR